MWVGPDFKGPHVLQEAVGILVLGGEPSLNDFKWQKDMISSWF